MKHGTSVWLATGAILLAVALTPSIVLGQDEARLQETRERIARGEQLYASGDFDGALVEFQRAHDLLEGHPLQYLAVYNIGRCNERLFRYDQAMHYYRRYLSEAGPDAPDRAEVRGKIELLEGLLGTIRLTVNVPTYEVWIDERLVGENVPTVMVPGGTHVVEIRSEGYAPGQQQAQVPSRTEQAMTFELEPLGEGFSGLHQAYFWSSLGLTLVTAGIGMVFGIMAMNENERLTELVDDPIEGWAVTQDDLDVITRWALTADVLYGVAGLFAIGAIVFAFITDWGGHEESSTASRGGVSGLSLMVSGTPDGAGLAVGGRF